MYRCFTPNFCPTLPDLIIHFNYIRQVFTHYRPHCLDVIYLCSFNLSLHPHYRSVPPHASAQNPSLVSCPTPSPSTAERYLCCWPRVWRWSAAGASRSLRLSPAAWRGPASSAAPGPPAGTAPPDRQPGRRALSGGESNTGSVPRQADREVQGCRQE